MRVMLWLVDTSRGDIAVGHSNHIPTATVVTVAITAIVIVVGVGV